jgi:geranylgeranyl pyrophosphate synthase
MAGDERVSAASGTAHRGIVEDGDEAAVAEIMRRGGATLRERMVRTEEHLERVAAEAGAPLAAYATATVLAGGKRLRPLLVVLAATAAGSSGADGRAPATQPVAPAADGRAPATQPVAPAADGRAPATQLAPPAADGDGGHGAEEDDQPLIRAAVAVELVHSATLVHDDVIDGAQLRRGHPSVVARAGRRMAIATGDLLFSRAFAELARNGSVVQLRALSDASSALAAGELLQREDAYAADVPVERYLGRCELKTAALFEAACRLGALVARRGAGESDGDGEPRPRGMGESGSDEERRSDGDGGRRPGGEVARAAGESLRAAGGQSAPLADALGAFARRIGLAFQLLDDVLDVSGPVERTGKARGTDLLDGTVTLPLILARQRDPGLASFDIAALRGPEQAGKLCDRIAATGALEDARERALALVAEAKATLPAILPNGRAVLLDLVADAVVERYR